MSSPLWAVRKHKVLIFIYIYICISVLQAAAPEPNAELCNLLVSPYM